MGNHYWRCDSRPIARRVALTTHRAWATLLFFMWTAVWGYVVPFIIEKFKDVLRIRRLVELKEHHTRPHVH